MVGEAEAGGLEGSPELLVELRGLLVWAGAVHKERSAALKAHNRNAVTLTTMHGSKGREWDYVFIISLNEGMFNGIIELPKPTLEPHHPR